MQPVTSVLRFSTFQLNRHFLLKLVDFYDLLRSNNLMAGSMRDRFQHRGSQAFDEVWTVLLTHHFGNKGRIKS